jgi:hypothetical protein
LSSALAQRQILEVVALTALPPANSAEAVRDYQAQHRPTLEVLLWQEWEILTLGAALLYQVLEQLTRVVALLY